MHKSASVLTQMSLAPETKALTKADLRLVEASCKIQESAGTIDEACFQHSLFCQIGMPRKEVKGTKDDTMFVREFMGRSILFEEGKLRINGKWVTQKIPYGPKPRLILITLSTTAVLTRSPRVNLGRSMRAFMKRIGIDPQYSEYKSMWKQMQSLAACHITFGSSLATQDKAERGEPITGYELKTKENRETLDWNGEIELSERYFNDLISSPVPLDERAVAALRGTALGLDIYFWLSYRLRNIPKEGKFISWNNFRLQFGQEYKEMWHFKQEFCDALSQARQVYPQARIEREQDGLLLLESKPPIPPRIFTSVSGLPSVKKSVKKCEENMVNRRGQGSLF